MSTDAKKTLWIEAAVKLLKPHIPYATCDYAASLYQTYVVEDDEECTPEEAVSEDRRYWGD